MSARRVAAAGVTDYRRVSGAALSGLSRVFRAIQGTSWYRTAPAAGRLRRVGAAWRGAIRDAVAPTRRERDHQHLSMLLAWLLEPDSTCIDVGAHRGEVLDLLLRFAPDGRHFAFEPLPQFRELLATRYPTVRVFDHALGEHDGTVKFLEVLDAPALSGLGGTTLSQGHPIRAHTVRVCRLDDVLPPDLRPRLIKIDVEGAEHAVLRGATETLRRWRPVVVFEHQRGSSTRTGADAFGVTPEDVHGLLVDLGYRVFDIDGNGPLGADDLRAAFDRETVRNFVAHP